MAEVNNWPGAPNTAKQTWADGETILAATANMNGSLANAIPAELGNNPSGTLSTVQQRFDQRAEQIWLNLGNVSGSVALPMAGYFVRGFIARPTAATTFTFSGLTEVGQWAELYVWQNAGPWTVTLPSAVWPDGAPGTITATSGARDRFGYQYMGGLDMHGFVIGNNIK